MRQILSHLEDALIRRAMLNMREVQVRREVEEYREGVVRNQRILKISRCI